MAFISVRSLLGTKSQQQPKKTTTNKQTSKKTKTVKVCLSIKNFPQKISKINENQIFVVKCLSFEMKPSIVNKTILHIIDNYITIECIRM